MIEAEEECSICLSPLLNEPQLTMECSHKYHKTCITAWLKRKTTCPLCHENKKLLPQPPSPKEKTSCCKCIIS